VRGSRALIRGIPLIVLIGLLVYLSGVELGAGRRWDPVAAVEFRSTDYAIPLRVDDFASFHLFRNARCGDCDTLSDLSSPPGQGRVGFAFVGDAAQLTVYFYGEGRDQVDPVVADFVAYLRASPRFDAGFRVQEHFAEPIGGTEGARTRR